MDGMCDGAGQGSVPLKHSVQQSHSNKENTLLISHPRAAPAIHWLRDLLPAATEAIFENVSVSFKPGYSALDCSCQGSSNNSGAEREREPGISVLRFVLLKSFYSSHHQWKHCPAAA